jgi:DNA-binding HxlR family transcriptional regulator
MLGRTYDDQNCSAARTLELVGERWSLLILRDAILTGTTRFSEFQRILGVAPNILANRLEGFVAAGLMETRRYSDKHDHHEYVLTDKGLDLQPVIIALTEWGDRWVAPHGPPVVLEHHNCGGRVHHQLTCTTCGVVPGSVEVIVQAGPGALDAQRAGLPVSRSG